MNLYILVALLVAEVIIFFSITRDALSPSLLLCVPFLIASIDLTHCIEYWNVNFNETTMLAVSLGCLMFGLGVITIQIIKRKKYRAIKISRLRYIHINKKIVNVYIFYELLVAAVSFAFVVNIAHSYGYSGSVKRVLFGYDYLMKQTTNDVEFPFVLRMLYYSVVFSTTIWSYIIINNYIVKKKVKINLLIAYLISLLSFLVIGSRGDMFGSLASTVIIGFIIYRKKRNGKKNISLKIYIAAILGATAMFILFPYSSKLLGRVSNGEDPSKYLSIYISGPLLNFNNWIHGYVKGTEIFGKATFSKILIDVLPKLGIQENMALGTKFNTNNGHDSGNVYTMFFYLYYDFGLWGIIILSFVLGLIVGICFYKAQEQIYKNSDGVPFWGIVYGYVAFLTVRCMFDNALFGAITVGLVIRMLMYYYESKYINRLKPIFRLTW